MTAVKSVESEGFSGRATRGLLWSSSQKWVTRIGSLVTVLILARLLTPEDFGLVAVALSVVPALYLLADLGFSTYLVQAENPTQTTLSTAFWYSAVSGTALAALVWAIGPVMEALLGVPGVSAVLMGLAPAVVLVSIGSVPQALLRREMRFRALALQGFAAAVCGQVVAVILAFSGAGVWALVAQAVVGQAIITVLAWISARWHPRWSFAPREFATMVRFGSSVVAVEFVAIGRLWAENAIVAATLGVAGLGYLNIAQRLITVAQDLTAATITPVTTVVFARIREQAPRLATGYLRAQGVVYAVVIPVMVFLAVGAGDLVPLLFGPQWTISILPAQALAFAGILTVGAALDQALFYGTGRPGRWLVYAVAIDVLTVVATWVLAPVGLAAVAWGFVGVAFVATCVRLPLVARRIEIGASALFVQFARALLLALTTAAGGGLAAWLTGGWPSVLSLFAVGVSLAATWLLALRFVMPAAAGEVVAQARALVGRIVVRPPHRRAHGSGAST